jgi:Rab3 GTPase-activating protein catalytic subunit
MGDSGAEESDDGWLDDCSSDDEPPVARGRSPDARNGAPSCCGVERGDEGTDSRGFIESPDARETPKEATDGWGVEDVELPRAGADDAHRDPPVHAAEADARVGFPGKNAGRKSLETKTTDRETDAPYLDFSVKSPWERFARAVETTARAWLRLTDDELRKLSTVNDSRPDHGSRDLRCLRAVVEHDNTHFRRDPYAVLLYFRDDAERPNVLAFGRNDARETPDEDAFPSDARNDARAKPFLRRSSISQRAICAPENDLAPGSVGVQRWFGAGLSAPFAVVEPLRANASSSVASVSRTFADVDEATAAKAAVAVAFAAAGVPSHWPVFAPVLGPARRAFVGRTGDDDANTHGGWSVRYETDSLEGVAAERAAARTVFGLCDVLRAQLAALHGALVAETLAAEAKVTARLAFPLLRNRRRRRRRKRNAAVGRGRSAATTRIDDESGSSSSSASSSSGGSSSESEDEDVRAGEAFLAVAGGGAPPRLKKKRTPEGADESVGATRKKNAESRGGFKNANLRWDDDAPWAPWAALPDPWRRVEVHATYRQVPLAELKELKGGLSLEAAPLWTVRAVPRGAAESTESGVFSAGAFFGDQSGPGGAGPDTVDDGSCSDDARGVTGARGARGPGGDAGGPERGLAELYYLLSRSVLTRAARDADTMGRLASAEFWDDEAATGVSPPPRAPPESVVQDVLRDIFSAEGEGGHGRVLANERNSLFPNPARSAPPDSLLARVALHALVFGNARAVATLWRRFVREIRFAHWDRGVALPRTGGVGFEAGRRRRFFGAREERAPEDHRTHAAEEEEDPEETAWRDECVDVRACLVHQKIQLIDACIRRRKQKSVDEYERSDAARERRDRDARDVSGGWDDVGGGWDDDVDFVTPSTTVSVDGVSRAISEKRRTNVTRTRDEHEISRCRRRHRLGRASGRGGTGGGGDVAKNASRFAIRRRSRRRRVRDRFRRRGRRGPRRGRRC